MVELTDMTFLLGPNGAGKTTVLQALARMFGLDPAQRRIRRSDFHVPADEAPELVMRAAGVIEADARAPLEDLEQAIGIPLQLTDEDEEVDTVAGLVATLAGRVPQRGEVIIHPSGYEFEVTDADPRRIRRLRIRPPSPASEAVPPGASA